MREIIICEDNKIQREQIRRNIEEYILIKNYHLKISLATGDPSEVMSYLENHPVKEGVYFLDIDLKSNLSGFELGTQIREKDRFARIIMVTGHDDMAHLVFKYKIEAMDYILKENPQQMKNRIRDCLDMIIHREKKQSEKNVELFRIEKGDEIHVYPVDSIMFFTTAGKPHRIEMYLETGIVQFYGRIKDIEDRHHHFFKCHESVVVNIKNIKYIDKKKRTLTMKNDDVTIVSIRRLKVLIDRVKNVLDE